MKKIGQQITKLSEALKAGESIDLTTDRLQSRHKAVLTLETTFLKDPLLSDLVDGKFRVFDKVVQSIGNEDDSISLIRKTALSKIPLPVLSEIFGHLARLSRKHGFEIPDLAREVKGPVIHILPVAIYT